MMTIKEYVQSEKSDLLHEFQRLRESYNIKATLAIIQVGDNPASTAYISGKMKDAEFLNVKTVFIKFPEDVSEKKVLKKIKSLNKKKKIHGIIVQLPLPAHISEEKVKLTISPDKDVDGFNYLSKIDPCTPKGIMDYLNHERYFFKDKNAVVIGRSDIVGKPMARLLTKANCNTTILHSKTSFSNLKRYVEKADLIVIAIGKPGFLDKTFKLKKSVYVFDVGINRQDGKLLGDCENGLLVKYQSPVPGGVGLLTRISVFRNLYSLIIRQIGDAY